MASGATRRIRANRPLTRPTASVPPARVGQAPHDPDAVRTS